MSIPPPAGIECIRVESAEEMFAETHNRIDGVDIFIGAAAISDYRPESARPQKIKKSDDSLRIDLPVMLASTAVLVPISWKGFRIERWEGLLLVAFYGVYVAFLVLDANEHSAAGTVVEVTHPLVRHKLGLLRDESTPTQLFRQLVDELTLLLTYEATKDMATEEVVVRTPLEEAWSTIDYTPQALLKLMDRLAR